MTTTTKNLKYSEIMVTIQNNVLKEDKPGKLKTHTKGRPELSSLMSKLYIDFRVSVTKVSPDILK